MTTSGRFADTHGLAGSHPNLTNSQSVVAWAESQNPDGAQAACGPTSSIPPWRSTRNFTEEANAHDVGNVSAEQHVHWQEQGRKALNFQQAGFETAAQQHEQAARDEVHVAVAQATEIGPERKCGKEWLLSKITQRHLHLSSTYVPE